MDFELAKSRATKHFIENIQKEKQKNSFPINLLNSDLHIKWRDDDNRVQIKNKRSSSDNSLNFINKSQLQKNESNQTACKEERKKVFENPNMYYSLKKIKEIDEHTYALRKDKSEKNIHINCQQNKQIIIKKTRKSNFSPENKFRQDAKQFSKQADLFH